jgi:hypothetical protein
MNKINDYKMKRKERKKICWPIAMLIIVTGLMSACVSPGGVREAGNRSVDSQMTKEVEVHMKRYFELFNNEQAEAIAREIYFAPVLIWKSGDENQSVALTAEEIHEQFNSTYKSIKANGWKQSVIHGMDIRIGGKDLAFVDMRFSRLMADGKSIPPVQRTWSYILTKRESGWRIISAHGQSTQGQSTPSQTAMEVKSHMEQ